MSKPTDQVYTALADTLRDLIEAQGLVLLSQPLRLEGWLRDLHPNSRAAVSVIMEGIHTDVYLENGPISELSALLSLRSGVSPQWADFGVRLWKSVLKGYDTERLMTMVTRSVVAHTGEDSMNDAPIGPATLHNPTVEEVLASYRNK